MTRRTLAVVMAVLAGTGLWGATANGAVRYVALDGSGANGLSWASAYRTIQEAVNDSGIGAGDEIWVKQGTYVLSSPVNVQKAVKIYGGYAGSGSTRNWETYVTTIDGADEAKRAFDLYADARVDGFRITGGHSWGIPPNQGGGVWMEDCSATVANCTFYDNYSELNGGAVGTLWAHGATITNCTFTDNTANLYGGAIYNYDSNVTISDCVFTGNTAHGTPDDVDPNDPVPGGGAIFNEEGQPTISNCTISGNSGYQGSGISNYFSDAYITGCTIENGDPSTVSGGGMYTYGGSPTIEGCLLRGNEVTWVGGAVLDVSTSTYINCIVCDNEAYFYGGGIYVNQATDDTSPAPVFINCTIYGNDAVKGGGIYNDNAIPTVTNCIIWGNTVSTPIDGPGIFDSRSIWPGAGTTATYSDIQGLSKFLGIGNLWVDPEFVDPGNDDFSLPFGSPCIDEGTNSVSGLPAQDYAGNPRVLDGNEDGTATVDMGAMEFRGRLVMDYLYATRLFQTVAFDDPCDSEPLRVFLLELETSSDVAYIQFHTPGGHTYTIPSDASTSGGGVETYHQVSGGTHLWGYRAETGLSNPMSNYGDGTYTVTLYYVGEDPHETDFWYGVPSTSTLLTMPSEAPNVTSPSYGGTTISPATFIWDACGDAGVNHVSVTVLDAGDAVLLTDVVNGDATHSNEVTLDEGNYSAEVAFESSYTVTTADNIPFEYGKAHSVGHQFEVVLNTVYRFWTSMLGGRHFYTMSAAERDYVIATWPDVWTYEGPAFCAYATDYVDGLVPLYRFWSPVYHSHFYTISADERDSVIATWPDTWTYEGIAFYVHSEDSPPAGASPVYRFWNDQDGAHFYTMSETERAHVLATWSYFLDEGIAFYAYEQP